MDLKKIGISFKKNMMIKGRFPKIILSLVFSNIFFFLLFGGSQKEQVNGSEIPQGWVEVQLNAELMTPFHTGKKVLIIHRVGKKKVEGVLQVSSPDQLGKITILVRETEAHALFQYDNWEVLPFLKQLNFASNYKESTHEIHY